MNNNNPKLSIITINYNDCEGLRRTIQSVASQSFKDFEYIVIDGGSTDGSKDIIEKYKDHLNVAISEKDTGIYNAMNKGASFATGEYLLFLNSGDTLVNNSVLSRLMRSDFSEDIVSCRMIWFDDKKQYLNTPPKNVSLFTFIGGSLPHPSTIIRNTIFKKIGGYSEGYRIISDWCFFVDALLQYNASYTTSDIVLSKFNGYGLSTTCGEHEAEAKTQYLTDRYPLIVTDYLSPNDEAIANVAFWAGTQSGVKKNIIALPFKIINRVLTLRNRLGKRLGVKSL